MGRNDRNNPSGSPNQNCQALDFLRLRRAVCGRQGTCVAGKEPGMSAGHSSVRASGRRKPLTLAVASFCCWAF